MTRPPEVEVKLVGFWEREGVELLQKLPIFSQLTYDETSRLAEIMEPHEVAAGAVVIEQEALGDALWIVQDGEVIVTREDAKGRSEELGRLGTGELFGEMSLVNDVLTSARVTAAAKCRLLKLPRPQFEALISSDETFALKVYRAFCRTLAERLRRANLLVSDKLKAWGEPGSGKR